MSKQAKKGIPVAKVASVARVEPQMYCRERILALNETNFFVNSQVARMDYKRLKKELDEGYKPPEIIGHVPVQVQPHSNIVLFPTKRMRKKAVGYDIKEDINKKEKEKEEKAMAESLIDHILVESKPRRKRKIVDDSQRTTKSKKSKKVSEQKDWEKEFENDIFKFYSGAYHATTCMMYAVAFSAATPHASVPLESGMRISLQLQIEKQANCCYPVVWPQEYSAGIPMDEKDPLYMLMKMNVESFLGSLLIPTNRRQPISIKHGSATHWDNLKIVLKKGNKKDTNLKTGILAFYSALKESKSILDNTAKKIIGGSLGHLIIDVFGVSQPENIRDLRLTYGSSSSGFRIHDDTGHTDGGSKDSITIHMNIFRTTNYIPGYHGSGPWKMSSEVVGLQYQNEDDSICNKNPYIDGYLGERFYRYSKSEGCFLKREEGNARDTNVWPRLPSKKLCSIILRDYQNIKVRKGEVVEEIFKKHNKVGVKKELKQEGKKN